jgi:hypothetical protein
MYIRIYSVDMWWLCWWLWFNFLLIPQCEVHQSSLWSESARHELNHCIIKHASPLNAPFQCVRVNLQREIYAKRNNSGAFSVVCLIIRIYREKSVLDIKNIVTLSEMYSSQINTCRVLRELSSNCIQVFFQCHRYFWSILTRIWNLAKDCNKASRHNISWTFLSVNLELLGKMDRERERQTDIQTDIVNLISEFLQLLVATCQECGIIR